MSIEKLHSFYLVGGTCLALKYGHRKSIGLDLFSLVDFTNDDLLQILEEEKIPFEYRNSNNPIGLFGYINNVKIDFVKHHYFKQIGECFRRRNKNV
ncbi:MAG: nucleotidyl transferase AbiEii/AbiGii toxin family protein [Ferruginibacter sp.]